MLTSSFLSLLAALASAAALPRHGRQATPSAACFPPQGVDATYDYVIIGGGTAGLAMAYRLAIDGAFDVAVIEAGDFYEKVNGNLSVVPGYELFGGEVDAADANKYPQVDWGFLTTPQPALDSLQFHYPRGKCLGGSSARNYLCYNRGTIGSYDMWAGAVADDSYKFDKFLPYFQKSVTYTPPNAAVRAANASVVAPNAGAYGPGGGNGPVRVSYSNWAVPWGTWARLGMIEAGLPEIQDGVSGKLIGSQHFITTIKPEDQTRSSSESGYLQSAFSTGRTNLKVYQNTLAKKILFDGKKTATGVRAGSAGKEYTLSARREVILSAGAFQSPQLLMLSGIGPRNTLQQFQIPVVSELAGVGQNMWDHVLYPVLYEVNSETLSSTLTDPSLNAQAVSLYNNKRQGVLGSNNADYVGWEKIPSSLRSGLSASTQSALSKFSADWPELEIIANDFGPFPGLPQPKNYGTLTTCLVAPLSRGNVTISSADAGQAPVINPNWLGDAGDVEQAVAAIKRMRQVFATKAIQGGLANSLGGAELSPGPSVQTDDQIRTWVRANTATVYHAACTCKMGVPSDPQAVVDNRARVFGVQGLRVVDASAFPLLPPGHPTSTVYALAEKIAADIIGGGKKRGGGKEMRSH